MKKGRSERGALKFSVGYNSPSSIFAFFAAGCVCTCASASLLTLAVARYSLLLILFMLLLSPLSRLVFLVSLFVLLLLSPSLVV